MSNKVKVLLKTVEINPADEWEDEIEVLDRETLEEIIDNLDLEKISHEAFNEARSYGSVSGSVDVEINARDGEVCISFSHNNQMTIGYYNTYIRLFSIETGSGVGDDYKSPELDIYLFTEDEHIAYYKELKERNDRILNGEEDGDIILEYKIKDAVIEKFNLDEDELLEEYFEVIDAENVDWLLDTDEINRQIEELYSHVVENIEE